MRGRRKMPVEQILYCIPAYAPALLQYAVVHPPLDLEKDRSIGIIVVKAEAQFETVFIPVDRLPVKFQVVRVEVKAVDWIGIVRLADAVLVQFQIRADKLANLQGCFFADNVLLLEARCLKLIVLWHRSSAPA